MLLDCFTGARDDMAGFLRAMPSDVSRFRGDLRGVIHHTLGSAARIKT